ncbi:MAG: protein kinase domain-containing protein [Ktedonobacterales bacterium]
MSSVSASLLDRRYRILADIGGYPGERHVAARHVELDIPVRLVTLQASAGQTIRQDGASERFRTRAAAVIALRHPGVVRVRDCFRQGARIAMVLDWTPEETVAAQLGAQGRLPLREVLALGLHLCDTLSAIARQAPTLLPLGTFTPDALAILPDGKCILTDLGFRNWLCARHSLSMDGDMTYRAPEALAGGPLDVRADIYSIAAILYTALAGAPPSALSAGRLPLSALLPLVPTAVCATLERALQLDPIDRYGSPEEFGAALGSAVRQTLPDLAAPAVSSRPLVQPPHQDTVQHPERIHRGPASEGDAPPSLLHWPLVWKQDLARVAAPIPLRRTGGRALAAISSALRLGA